jgi:large subunit ribosomal protein L9
MEVILLKDVKGVGKKQQTVEVSDGYANNFLLPKKLAVKVSKKSIEVLENQKEEARIAEENAKNDALKLAETLKTIEVKLTAKVGDKGRMFGTISTKQICEELEAKHGINIDKRKFVDKGPFDSIGFYNLKVELYKGIFATIKVQVVGVE